MSETIFVFRTLAESPNAIWMAGFVGKKFGNAKITPKIRTD